MVEFIRQYAQLVHDNADEQSGVGRSMRSPPRGGVVVDAMTKLKEIVKERHTGWGRGRSPLPGSSPELAVAAFGRSAEDEAGEEAPTDVKC